MKIKILYAKLNPLGLLGTLGIKWKNHQENQHHYGKSPYGKKSNSICEIKTPGKPSDPSEITNSFIKEEQNFQF